MPSSDTGRVGPGRTNYGSTGRAYVLENIKRVLRSKTQCVSNMMKTSNEHDSRLRKIRRKRKKGKEKDLVDRFSALPEELVDHIVSFLPIKEAVATSILSRRCKHVWKSFKNLELKPEAKDAESGNYVDFVNGLLQHHSSPSIQLFKVSLDNVRRHRFLRSTDEWIQFAMNKRVQILELEFPALYPTNTFQFRAVDPTTYMYQFPRKLLGNDIGFKFLKVLSLQSVDVTPQVFDYFLSNCPSLERLTVICTNSLSDVRVVGPSISLKHLALLHCYGLKSIEVRDANLVSFWFHGVEVKELLLMDLPLLTDVQYTYLTLSRVSRPMEIPFTKLSSCLHQLESLMLSIALVDYNPNLVFPPLANLKHLELEAAEGGQCQNSAENFPFLTCFMKAAPYLQSLKLKLVQILSRYGNGETWKAGEFSHHHLRVLNVEEYGGGKGAAGLVMFVVKHAIALEKIVIDPVKGGWFCWGYPRPKSDRGVEQSEDERKARSHAMEHLKVKVPCSIEFVCM